LLVGVAADGAAGALVARTLPGKVDEGISVAVTGQMVVETFIMLAWLIARDPYNLPAMVSVTTIVEPELVIVFEVVL